VSSSSVQQPVSFDEPDGERLHGRRLLLYRISTAVLSLIVLLAVVEALVGLPMFGVDHEKRTAASGGTELTVEYPRLTRGQLDSGLTVTVRRQSGFDGPVTIEITRKYLAEFNVRRVTPEPTSEADDGDAIALTFDPPSGDTLEVQWDMAARPTAWFTRVDGRATVSPQGSEPAAAVGFESQLRP
jgi:hypothetical protein